MNLNNCPVCTARDLQTVNADYETSYVDVNGIAQALKVLDLTWLRCLQCGEEFLDDTATAKIEDARREALNRLSPSALRRWRTEISKTQTELSNLLALGAKTFTRWETGAFVPNACASRFIRLLMIRPDLLPILERLAAFDPIKRQPVENLPRANSVLVSDLEITDLEVAALVAVEAERQPMALFTNVFSGPASLWQPF